MLPGLQISRWRGNLKKNKNNGKTMFATTKKGKKCLFQKELISV